MYLKRLSDSVAIFPNISELSDNTNRLYSIEGSLFFNGTEVGSGSGDASNVWTNANDYSTYTTVTSNIYNTWSSLDARINAIDAGANTSVSDLVAGIEGANTNINTIQSNIDTGISTGSLTPTSDDEGYVGNTLLTWASGRFTNFEVDQTLHVSGSTTIEGNLIVTGNVVTVNASELSLEDNMIYLNANNTITNPDLGFAGNYNDGTYQHAGFFRDASDGYWKVYDSYTPEPDDSPYINTAHESFTLAIFQSRELRGNLVAASAVVNSVDLLANDHNTYTTVAGLINTVNANVAALPNAAANDFNTYTTVTDLINTVQDNVAALPDTAGALLDLSGTTLNVDLSELATSTTNDHGDYFVVVDTSNTQRKLTKANINISEFNNDAGYATSAGVWTEDTGRAYYAGKVVVNSANAQTEQFYVNGTGKVSGNFEVGGTLTESSSVALKENIVPLNNQLDKLMLLRPVEYDKIDSRMHEYGLIAEEVANVIPQAVSLGNSAVQYTRLVPALISAIQELKMEIGELKRGSTID